MDSEIYFLGVWQQKPNQRGFGVHDVAELSATEFEDCLNAIATYRALLERNVYSLLQRHWHRLSSMQQFYANIERVGGNFRVIDLRTVAVTFMDEVTNWLTTGRLYLESERDLLSRTSQDGQEDLKRFRSLCGEVFDSIPAYRFLYKLRDYTQHCGPPLGSLIVAGANDGDRTIQISIRRSDLLIAHFNWGSHVRELINEWPENILLLPLIEEAMAGFRRIEDEILRILLKRCAPAVPLLRSEIQRVAGFIGHPAIFRFLNGTNISYQSFPSILDLDILERSLSEPDPLSAIRSVTVGPTLDRSPERLHSEAQAVAVLGAWLEHGAEQALFDAINRVLKEDQAVEPLISGLVNLGAYLLSMLSTSLGTSPQALLGSFLRAEGRSSQ